MLLVKKATSIGIGNFYNDFKVKSLLIMIPKTSTYVKSCDGQTK